ncbi:MAG: ORF6N domain-containing protein [Odoribacter sp.]|nr:ORF6N domain-containing protein [Odoribacter sp.]
MEENNDILSASSSGATNTGLLPVEELIHIIRGQQVMIDSDLAQLYGVETKRLKEQVKRNINRFPADFMFQLTKGEAENLRSPFATSGSRSQFVTLKQATLATTGNKNPSSRSHFATLKQGHNIKYPFRADHRVLLPGSKVCIQLS